MKLPARFENILCGGFNAPKPRIEPMSFWWCYCTASATVQCTLRSIQWWHICTESSIKMFAETWCFCLSKNSSSFSHVNLIINNLYHVCGVLCNAYFPIVIVSAQCNDWNTNTKHAKTKDSTKFDWNENFMLQLAHEEDTARAFRSI